MQINLTGLHKEFVEIETKGMTLEFTDKQAKSKLCRAIDDCFQERKELVRFLFSEFELSRDEVEQEIMRRANEQ